MNPRIRKLLWLAPVALAGFAAFGALGGLVVRELWNALMPSLFGWKALTWAQALGLLVLSRILFGGFGVHGGGPSRMRRRMEERTECLSAAERERLRAGLQGPGAGASS